MFESYLDEKDAKRSWLALPPLSSLQIRIAESNSDSHIIELMAYSSFGGGGGGFLNLLIIIQ